MKKYFRYDYNYKLLILSNLPTAAFLAIAIASFEKNDIGFFISILASFFCFLNTYVFINNQGIRVTKGKVIIVDSLYLTSINLFDLKYVEVKELEKEQKFNIYGFLHEFFHRSTYMQYCDYTYNNGKVFKIVFYLKNGVSRESYFGWMYREKSKDKVSKIQSELTVFVKHINKVCQEYQQR